MLGQLPDFRNLVECFVREGLRFGWIRMY